MAEQGVCPSETEMEYEEKIAQLQQDLDSDKRVIAELDRTVERVAQEKAELVAALEAAAASLDNVGAHMPAEQAREALAKVKDATRTDD